MYAKVLKETAFQLTLLVVENDSDNQAVIGQSLEPFFKEIEYAANEKEALLFCRSEKFDLVLIDMDTVQGDIHRFIREIQKQDAFQSIVVTTDCSDDAQLMLKLLNSGVSGLLPRSVTHEEMCKILLHICTRVHDRHVMLHYLEEMEKLHDKVLRKCYTCSVKSALINGTECKAESAFLPAEPAFVTVKSDAVVEDDDDDFMFFPEPSASAPAEPADNSLYQDYFSFLEFDDREELHDQLSDIDASLFNAFSDRGGDSQEISRLGTSLMRYGNVLLHYQFFSDMGTSILEFGKMISDECESIAARSDDLELLISGFCSGLQTYMHEVWDKSSDNPKFFNDSIINDAGTIMGMIAPSSAADNDDDLVFF